MKKYQTLIIILVIIIFLMGLVYTAYLVDTNKIAIYADEDSNVSTEDLKQLPSPDDSIISKIYTAIIKPFTK